MTVNTGLLPEPTNAEKMRGLPWAIVGNVGNTVFNNLTVVGGAVSVLFLNELGLSKTQLGFTLSLVPFFGLLALFIAPTVARYGFKRAFLAAWGARSVSTALFLLTPWVLMRYGSQSAFIFIIVVVALKAIFQTINATASHPWVQEFVPNAVRGKFTATSNLWGTLSGLLAVAGAGYVLENYAGLGRFGLLFGIGVCFSLIAIWAMSFVPGGAAIVSGKEKARYPYHQALVEAVRDIDFRRYLIGVGLVTLGTVPLAAFFPLFMQDEVGLSSGQVVWLGTGALLGSLLSIYLWGWAADRYGSKPVMLSSLIVGTLLSVCWLLIPRHSDLSFYMAMALAFLLGLVSGGWGIGYVRLLYVSVVPPARKTQYMALFQAWIGLVTGVSLLVAGQLLDYSGGVSGQFLFLTLSPYLVLFAARLIFPLASVLFLKPIRADESVTTGEFVGMFLRGNPFVAMESLIGFHRAKSEIAAVSMTERLGQAKSPLIVEELLEALADPRFNVRFEAIISIARTRADDRLTQALARVLKGDNPALSVIAAWALGRIGEPGGRTALGEGLNSRYRSVQAHCARALGALDDSDSIPLLRERLNTETDPGLQMAYASALGQLGAGEATDKLLVLLRGNEDEEQRMELTLALARIVGNDSEYIQLFRATQAEVETPISQAVFSLKKKLDRLVAADSDLPALVDDCANAWAKGDTSTAAACLRQLILLVTPAQQEGQKSARITILHHCAERLDEFGAARIEYVLLALHTLNTGWL